ncbi:MAG: CDP-glycerol glycerophosphotransferase family protein [bacterium]|nr:CDP-glycerol glycerophosphotransferase family protein [bacterium]
MKTIFITIFQGVEAKNILRTGIVKRLLEDSRVRVVLFVGNKEKAQLYQREFSHPRMIYEIVPRPLTTALDRFFASLKFQLLRTDTTHLRKKMAFEKEGNRILFFASKTWNWIIARKPLLRFARFLDYRFVHDATYSHYFETYRPDIVFMAHLFDEQEIHLLREAKKRNIRTIGFINSWDKVTARCVLRLLPDRFVVFNDIVKEELATHNAVDPSHIFIGGIPQYDLYFKRTDGTRDDFFKAIGSEPQKKLIVYAPMGSAFSGSDWDMLDVLCRYNKKGVFGNAVDLLVRFQPNDFIDKKELEKRPWLLYDYPGIRFSSKRGVDWDMSAEDVNHLAHTLAHMSVLVCYASSMSVDAAIFDKPVININFELKHMPLHKSPTQFYHMAHYKKALCTGGIRCVENEKELIGWIRRYIGNPSLDAGGRDTLVRQQCFHTDGESGRRIGEYILSFLHTRNV